jgi:endo-alpha-1,4-polygalactosaminidase (GH114 family)
MDVDAYFAWLTADAKMAEVKIIGDGIYAAIKPLMFHWTLVVGQVGNYHGYEDQWCMKDRATAEKAIREWDGNGEPKYWHRHPLSGRRRVDGDPSTEYVGR